MVIPGIKRRGMSEASWIWTTLSPTYARRYSVEAWRSKSKRCTDYAASMPHIRKTKSSFLASVEELLQSELLPISFTTRGYQRSRRTWLTSTISIWNCFDSIPRSSRKSLAVLAISITTCRRRDHRLLSQVSNLLEDAEAVTAKRTGQPEVLTVTRSV